MTDKKIKAKFESDMPIDFELLKFEIAEKGPLRLSKQNSPVEIYMNILACECGDDLCDEHVVSVERKCGLSRIIWQLDSEELCEFESLSKFSEWVFQFGLDGSLAERQIMEHTILTSNGSSYDEIDRPFCACSDCMKNIGPEAVWKGVLLANIAINLQQQDEWRRWVDQYFTDDENDISQFFEDVFDLGYQTARMYGEYQLKTEIEASAIIGMKAQKNQEKRAEAAGEISRRKRNARILCLLEKMEFIAKRSPDVTRLGPKALAELALSDVVQEDSELWKQGKGRRDEYLGEMKADIRYRKRYNAIFKR